MKSKRHLPEEHGYQLFFLIALLFSVVTAVFKPMVAVAESISTILLYLVFRGYLAKRNKEIMEHMKSRENDIEAATRGTIINAPLPMVIFQPETDEIIWSNDRFLAMTGNPEHVFDTKLSDVVPQFQCRWVTEGKHQAPEPVRVRDAQYLVFGNLIEGNLAISYWVEVTRYAWLEENYDKSRPIAAVLLIDNYDDLMRSIEESERSVLLSELNKRISQWADSTRGILCHYDRDHYLFLFEEGQLPELQKQKFSILESVRQVRSRNEVTATLSIGVGRDAPNLRELFHYATQSMEMALSRGGDQLVIKDRENYQFFGGKAKESDRRTKVKSRVVANALSELLSNATQILIMGHFSPDLDVVGAAVGLNAIARKRGVPAYIIQESSLNPAKNMIDDLARLPEYETVFISEEEALSRLNETTLLVVVDTNRPEQVQVPALLTRAKRLVIIDHHRRAASHIENPILSFEDPYASSASELATELLQYILEPGDLLRQEAEAVLSGIVLDTKNFTLRTGGRTFEAAAYLRRQGADTTEVRKLFQSDLQGTISRFGIVQKTKIYREGIAMAISETPVDRVTAAKAADELISMTGIHASFVLFPTGDNQIAVSARSNGNINVQVISELLGGGGNAAAAGAQIKGLSLEEAEQKLKEAIDRYFDEI
ncbi:MAG: family phosphoesterase [Evtepia sp.]|jgi:c-di-AMP phosphodiesterase-like protein|nr:family phosphoesterase [Evtepia sp.]